MDVYPKFILERNGLDLVLIIGKCTYHNELATNIDKVKGGGWYRIKDDVMTFHGDSMEFGKASLEDIQECITDETVFDGPMQLTNLSKDYKFMYDNHTKQIALIEIMTLYKIAQKYSVEITHQINFNKKGIITISNNTNSKTVEYDWLNLGVAETKTIAKELHKQDEITNKKLVQDLEERAKNKELFPDDLFKKAKDN